MTATLTAPHEAAPATPAPRQPRWVRPAFWALLAGTAVLYLWGLGASGYGNDFYAAAVQAGTKSWKAMFFGAFDASSFITVDKPPASLWVMALSGRLFGFSSWSMLVPQALEGVATVALLFAAVRRVAGPVAGLLAGAVCALTPVAVLMFRFNNPDALLTLLLVAAGYAVVRATERAALRWLLLAGALVGFGFLTKMLQAFLVIPAFGLVYLIAAPTGWWRRLLHLLAALGAVLVSAGWWVAAVELWPASSRPYIGGSTNNSILDLTFGYNGLGRIFGNGQPGGGGGGPGGPGGGGGGGGGFAGGPGGGGGFGGGTGWSRMFGDSFGTQISWLIPAALIALVLGLWVTRRRPRTDLTRASLVVWGGWLVVTGLVFSYMQGIVHPYYSVVLAPPIGALVGIGGRELWHRRGTLLGRLGLAAMVAVTGVWSDVLLNRTPTWYPELRYGVLALSALAVVGLVVGLRATLLVTAIVGLVAGLGATAAYAVDTAATPHTGSIPAAGPAGARDAFGGGGPGGGFAGPGNGTRTGRFPGGFAGPPSNATGGAGGSLPGGGAGPDSGGSANSALVALLKQTTTTWAAATNGAQSAAPLQLASGRPIMSIGGFGGGDPAPTLAQFQAWVSAGKIRYYIGGGGGGFGGGGGRGGGSEIATWVAAHFSSTTVGGTTVYDLAAPTS